MFYSSSDVFMSIPYEGSYSDRWFRKAKAAYEGKHSYSHNVVHDWDDCNDEDDMDDEEWID